MTSSSKVINCQPQLIFIVGATGAGKSDAGFLLAQKLDGEIVSCDAMQVYREVNIACDKPCLAMRRTIAHHMLDVVSVTEDFDVARFRQMAIVAIDSILRRGKRPIIVGGSGMYAGVLLDGIFKSSAKDESLRARLQERVDKEGGVSLHRELMAVDPKAAAKIHPHDTKRIIRALEVVMTTGIPISQMHKEREGLWGKYSIVIHALNRSREDLYQRAEARVERMFEQGLIEEMRALMPLPLGRTAATLIGISEVRGYLDGNYDLERTKYLMKRNTRHYIKRQMTWFRRDERLQWMDIAKDDSMETVIERMMSGYA